MLMLESGKSLFRCNFCWCLHWCDQGNWFMSEICPDTWYKWAVISLLLNKHHEPLQASMWWRVCTASEYSCVQAGAEPRFMFHCCEVVACPTPLVCAYVCCSVGLLHVEVWRNGGEAHAGTPGLRSISLTLANVSLKHMYFWLTLAE